MSRGPGRIQRAILDLLDQRGEFVTLHELATAVHGGDVTRSQYEATRRAAHGLVQRGLAGRSKWNEYGSIAVVEAELRREYAANCQAYGADIGPFERWSEISVAKAHGGSNATLKATGGIDLHTAGKRL